MFWNAVCASHGTPTRLSVSIITRISKVRKLRHSDSQGSTLVRSRAGALTQDARLTSHVPKDHAQLSLRIKRPVVHADTGPRSYMHVFNSSSKCELTAGKAVRTVARLRPCRPFRDPPPVREHVCSSGHAPCPSTSSPAAATTLWFRCSTCCGSDTLAPQVRVNLAPGASGEPPSMVFTFLGKQPCP